MDKPKKKNFIIKINGTASVQATFKVLAENEDEAFKIFETNPSSVYFLGMSKIHPKQIQKKKVSIREELSNFVRWVRNF